MSKSMILIALLATGEIEWQPLDADLCRHVEASLQAGSTVQAETEDGSRITIVQGLCIADDLRTRLELAGPALGLCDTGEGA